jgi:hypothetical protein
MIYPVLRKRFRLRRFAASKVYQKNQAFGDDVFPSDSVCGDSRKSAWEAEEGRDMKLTKDTVTALTLPEGKIVASVRDDSLPGFGVRLRGTTPGRADRIGAGQ